MSKNEISALDVASYILKRKGVMSTMKLLKLVYYGQAWSLVWDDCPLFKESVRAWRDGPVVKELWDACRGMFYVGDKTIGGNPSKLDKDQRETVDVILESYGQFDGLTLSNKTHNEKPWKDARKGYAPQDYSDTVISHHAMKSFYSNL